MKDVLDKIMEELGILVDEAEKQLEEADADTHSLLKELSHDHQLLSEKLHVDSVCDICDNKGYVLVQTDVDNVEKDVCPQCQADFEASYL